MLPLEFVPSKPFMIEALRLANSALALREVPVGAVVVHQGEIVGRGYNCRESRQNALFHAEIRAINEACLSLESWRLDNCEIYVTLEPCMMCSGAIVQSRIPIVVYAADSQNTGFAGLEMHQDEAGSKISIHRGFLEEEANALLKTFFSILRN